VIPAEVRGHLRVFKARAADRRALLDASMQTQAFNLLVASFCSGIGNRAPMRAIAKLRQKLDRVATFEITKTHRPRMALWSSIVSEEHGARVECLLISRGTAKAGGWLLLASGHSLVRYYQRGGADLEAALTEANRECARGRFHRLPSATEIAVKGGPGYFCGIIERDDDDTGTMKARTWMHSDQLQDHEEQKLVAAPAG
jgi:hypothetical protein